MHPTPAPGPWFATAYLPLFVCDAVPVNSPPDPVLKRKAEVVAPATNPVKGALRLYLYRTGLVVVFSTQQIWDALLVTGSIAKPKPTVFVSTAASFNQ